VRFRRAALRILAALAILYVYFATLHPRQKVPPHVFFERPGPWAIAHRGGLGLWPENTLLALENAVALGIDVLEVDLRVTAEGVIVLMHDRTVDRTTNGKGRIDQMSLAEVRSLDAGYQFRDAAGRFVYRGRGLVVPTLQEVLSRFGTARLNLEMKAPDCAARLCELLRETGATSRVLVASFDHQAMSAFRQGCPSVATSATLREGLLFYYLNRMRLASLYRSPAVAFQVPESLRGRKLLEPELLQAAATSNVKVQVWTVNEQAGMKRLLDMGVHGILTDYPDRLLRLMGRSPAQARQAEDY
jgi:glycerophosphoryl diester phosphodiesterase